MKDARRSSRSLWQVCALTTLSLVTLLGVSSCAKDGYTVQVLLSEADGYTINSENPMTVRAGEDAVFSVTLDEGYTFVQALDGEMQDLGATWNEGTLTIPAVRTPLTVNMTALEDGSTVKFFLENGTGGGWVGMNTEEFTFLPGTPVRLTAKPHEGYYFAGWTKGKSMDAGGTLLSYDADTTYEVTGRESVYGNFYPIEPEEAEVQTSSGVDNLTGPTKYYGGWGMQGNESTHMIQYNANGGTVVGYDSDTYYDVVSTAVYSCPNTLAEKGIFAREGYVLLEYNTKADGTGTAIPCGGKFAPAGESTTLYCIWAQYTDPTSFTFVDNGKGLTLKGYSGGDQEMLVIPEYVGAQKVTHIAANAFKDVSLGTIVIPKSVETVENNAFMNCSGIKTLCLFDSIKQIYDAAFNGSPWLQLHLGAVRDPVFSNHEDATFVRKWEKLLLDGLTDTQNLVICSGSSSYYGLDTPLLEELLGNEYSVINFGNVATCNVSFFMDGVADYLGADDILVQAPEVAYGGEMGDPYFYWVIYRIIEHGYDFLYHVDDMTLYYNVLGGLTEFNSYREYMEPLSYDIFSTNVDENGDITFDMPNGSANAYFGVQISYTNVNKDWLANLTKMHDRITETGCRVYFSFAPFNYNAVEANSRKEAVWDKFMETMRNELHVPVISYIWDYKMDGYLMYNSDYHTAEEGRGIRTRQLASDILAQLAKEAES